MQPPAETHDVGAYVFIFMNGLAGLALEIIGPRLMLSIYGGNTTIWAAMISTALLGLSCGYWLGGRCAPIKSRLRLAQALAANAVWLNLSAWIVRAVARLTPDINDLAFLLVPLSAFFIPYVLFGACTPLVIAHLAMPGRPPSRLAGNVYALGTVGSVFGALLATYRFVPQFGLTASLRLISLFCIASAIYFLWKDRRLSAGILFVAVSALSVGFPQATLEWDTPATLLWQGESQYATIRVFQYADGSRAMRVGQSLSSATDANGDPTYPYAQTIVHACGDVTGLRVAILGGAGHAMSHYLERHGAIITEVEIDPVVSLQSDAWFGAIQGTVVQADARPYLERLAADTYDLIILDAYDGAITIPISLTSREAFAAMRHALSRNGRLLVNAIGAPSGQHAKALHSLEATIATAFIQVRASRTTEDSIGNVILLASADASPTSSWNVPVFQDGIVFSDDVNASDLLTNQSTDHVFFSRLR